MPGQILAADPKGRACIIASIEKNKLVYVLNRNAEAKVTISSPPGAHKDGVLVLSVVSLGVGYANPVFAALELSSCDLDQDLTGQEEPETQLVYYELDLGLNHVVRKWSEPVNSTSSLLFQVPGGNHGPGGVLVCSEESITYKHYSQKSFRVPIPKRWGATEDLQRKCTIVSGVMHKLKDLTGNFFFLLQTEDGDLFKVTIDVLEHDNTLAGEVQRLRTRYFDTIPVTTSLCILKSGFLFAASEFGKHHFYQFKKLGDDEPNFTSDDYSHDFHASYSPVYFSPRLLDNLILIESINSSNPLLDCEVADLLGEDMPQLYMACGNAARSTFRTLKHGLEVSEAIASELPSTPLAVWTNKLNRRDKFDAYIILAFSTST